jgi:hypothetical protein
VAFIAAIFVLGTFRVGLGEELNLPERAPEALTGSALVEAIRDLSLEEREQRILNEIRRGNVPSSLRKLVPLKLANEVTLWVLRDYLAVGSDEDALRLPLSPQTAQALAEDLGMTLPTPKVVDAIWAAAEVKLKPQPIPPSPRMISVPVFGEHQAMIETQLRSHQGAEGNLIAGHKKDVVICQGLTEVRGKVAIYGWHRRNGEPIQPLYLGHSDRYVDYSHGIRWVAQAVTVKGETMAWDDVLADPVLSGVLSHEGALQRLRYAAADD